MMSQEIARRFHQEEQSRAKGGRGGATQSPTHYQEDVVQLHYYACLVVCLRF